MPGPVVTAAIECWPLLIAVAWTLYKIQQARAEIEHVGTRVSRWMQGSYVERTLARGATTSAPVPVAPPRPRPVTRAGKRSGCGGARAYGARGRHWHGRAIVSPDWW